MDDDREELFSNAVNATFNNEDELEHLDSNVAPSSDNLIHHIISPVLLVTLGPRGMMTMVSIFRHFLWKRRSRLISFKR